MRSFALLCALVMAVLTPSRAEAVTLGLDLGGGYWFNYSPQFDFHVKVQFALGSVVSVGIRPGILLNVSPGVQFGVPIDAYFRFHISRVFFDLIGGLALIFGDPELLRAHGAVGFGVHLGKGFSLGFEGGWLQNGAQLLGRFGWAF